MRAPLARRYLPGTLILETTWTTDSGWLLVLDALTITEWAVSGREERGMGRPDAHHEADRTLIRIATCIDGEVEAGLDCRPRFEYGAQQAEWTEAPGGELEARGSEHSIHLATDIEPSIDGDRVTGELRLQQGQSCFAAICWDSEAARRAAPRRPASALTPPRTSGGPGCATEASPTTPGACIYSARPSS